MYTLDQDVAPGRYTYSCGKEPNLPSASAFVEVPQPTTKEISVSHHPPESSLPDSLFTFCGDHKDCGVGGGSLIALLFVLVGLRSRRRRGY